MVFPNFFLWLISVSPCARLYAIFRPIALVRNISYNICASNQHDPSSRLLRLRHAVYIANRLTLTADARSLSFCQKTCSYYRDRTLRSTRTKGQNTSSDSHKLSSCASNSCISRNIINLPHTETAKRILYSILCSRHSTRKHRDIFSRGDAFSPTQ